MLSAASSVPFDPEDLISSCKKVNGLDILYLIKVRHYTIEQHTLLVLRQFEKYFINVDVCINRPLFRMLLAIHDIGKGLAFERNDIGQQHNLTVEIVMRLYKDLGLSEIDRDIIIAAVRTDTLGAYFQGKISVISTVDSLVELARSVNMLPLCFLRMMLLYYQSDVGSYTKDAGGFSFLEHLFVYKEGDKILDEKRQILKFSPVVENRLANIEQALK